jgi:hypothetical protein
MKQQVKYSEITVRSETIREKDFVYRYVLYYKEDLHARGKTPLYSIRAQLSEQGGETSYAQIEDAFADPGHALIFFELCKEHKVMPAHLSDVLEDFER